MDFFGDDKFASTVQKTVTTRKTVLVRPATRPATSRLPSTDHASVPASNRLKTSGSRNGTPVGTPNKRRKVAVEEPERKRARRVKATPSRRTASPGSSSSSEEDPLPPRLVLSPAEDDRPVLTESSPITRQVFRPTLIHSESMLQRPPAVGGYKGFIPSTSIVASHLAKYRPCTFAEVTCDQG